MSSVTSVNVIGLGYIGLPTAAILASKGINVLGVDVRPDIVEKINNGSIHIYEPGLDELARFAFQQGRLHASLEPKPAQAHIIAVPTPVHDNHAADLSYVESATRTIAKVLHPGDLVILESTVPPCTCECFIAPLLQELTGLVHGKDYDLAHCPERVIPGNIIIEITRNDRIVGGTTPHATRRTAELYATFVTGTILETDASTAEMCKLMENTFRDVNIALANELAGITAALGINIHEAIRLANHHPRVNIHSPGIGVGGHCIPVDPWFIINAAPEKASLLRMARNINDSRPGALARQILEEIVPDETHGIAFLGLSYKADVDDTRESPAIEVVKLVAEQSPATIYVVEPHITCLPLSLSHLPNVILVTVDEVLVRAEVIVSLVAHKQFTHICRECLNARRVIDAARIWVD